jgi:uncharacterized protein
VIRIYRHLKDDIGFHEVGFAPVTTAGEEREYSLNGDDMTGVLAGFHALADEWLDYALQGRMHGFTNVSETIGELIQGTNKSHPCGAGLGLLGVSPSGDLSPCHRFTDADTHTLGHISTGIDQGKREDFLRAGTSRPNTNANRAGRARSAPAAAITRPSSAMAIPATPTCIIATGSANGPTRA